MIRSNRYRQLAGSTLERSELMVLWIRRTGEIVSVNDSVCRFLGYSSDALEKMSVWEIDPNMTIEVWEQLTANLTDVSVSEKETLFVDSSGNQHTVVVSGYFVVDDGEELVFAIAQDNSCNEHTRKIKKFVPENTLRFFESIRTQHDIIFDKSSDSIIIGKAIGSASDDAVIVDVNPATCRILGYKKEELIGQPTSILRPPSESGPSMEERRRALFSKGQDIIVTKHLTKTGQLIDVELSTHICEIRNEKYIIAICRDITARLKRQKQIENLLDQEQYLRSKLEKQNYERTEFYRALVHELKTPLTPIMLTAEVLADKMDNEFRIQWEAIFNGAQAMELIINDLHDLVKSDVGTLTINPVEFVLDDLIDEAVELMSSQFNNKNIIVDKFFCQNKIILYADRYTAPH